MSGAPAIAMGTPLNLLMFNHLLINRLSIQVSNRLLISVRRYKKCRIVGFSTSSSSGILVFVGSCSIAIAIASAIARVPVASVISLKSLVSKISSGLLIFAMKALISLVSSGAMVIAMKALISSISMRWSQLSQVAVANWWVSSVPRISSCRPSLQALHHLLVVSVLSKHQNVFPTDLMVSHVDDFLLVVEASQNL